MILTSQICLFWGHLGNRLAKMEKIELIQINVIFVHFFVLVDFHWKNEANR